MARNYKNVRYTETTATYDGVYMQAAEPTNFAIGDTWFNPETDVWHEAVLGENEVLRADSSNMTLTGDLTWAQRSLPQWDNTNKNRWPLKNLGFGNYQSGTEPMHTISIYPTGYGQKTVYANFTVPVTITAIGVEGGRTYVSEIHYEDGTSVSLWLENVGFGHAYLSNGKKISKVAITREGGSNSARAIQIIQKPVSWAVKHSDETIKTYIDAQVASVDMSAKADVSYVDAQIAANSTPSWGTIAVDTTVTANSKNLVDTSAGALTITLPASPTVGTEIMFVDGAGQGATNNITVNGNGEKIQGLSEDLIINVNRAAFQVVYFNAVNGWVFMEV